MTSLTRFVQFVILVLFLPAVAFAGFFSSNSNPVHQPKQFHCPYRCGQSGSQALEDIDLAGFQIIWELDRLAHAAYGKEFEYACPHNLDYETPWINKFAHEGALVDISHYHKGIKRAGNACFRNHCSMSQYECGCIDYEIHEGFLWNYYFESIDEDGSNHSEPWRCLDCTFSDYYASHGKWGRSPGKKFEFIYHQDIRNFVRVIEYWLKEDCINLTDEFYSKEVPWIEDRTVQYEKHLKALEKNLKDLEQKIERIGFVSADWNMEKEDLDKAIQYTKTNIQSLVIHKDRIYAEKQLKTDAIATYTPLIFSRLAAFNGIYQRMLEQCILEHKVPAAYYNRARWFFDQGLNMNCLEDSEHF